ncbi:twin-arginine translocase TatA/TatE family subunit [Simiduia curdlanivorans]|uniref:Sec-independent protein translocase protein TatA n=1 Tax=Simiduia curdlanivorans TaxID=1492769 RepID=A0ABV8V2T8_9GAMM|nr:twin-arginine translocase TatA/TatE family subunit [Simiduia curdlanivorans]MDN3637315.1 twin-arginine translocase TatA/TatE family subunit [Simiduia curdlanivorans]
MGLGGISIWQLLIILVIIILLFGTKRLRGLGGDIGDAIKGFRKAVSEDKKPEALDDQKAASADQPAEKTDAKSEQK